MYIDVPRTANAVVVCVVIFNAAFGYSWGPLPWLYPPEVRSLSGLYLVRLLMKVDHASVDSCQRCLAVDEH